MNIHFLGTTGYHPNEHQHTMCVMIPELGIVLDAGTGMFRVRDLIQTDHLRIFLSHAHLDHVLGLTYLFDVLFQKPTQVELYAETEKLAALHQHLFSPLIFPVRPSWQECPLEQFALIDGWLGLNASPSSGQLASGQLASGQPSSGQPAVSRGRSAFRCCWFPLEHPGGAVGYRIEVMGGGSLAYVTDTTASRSASYLDQIRGVDLLIHECYFPDGYEEKAKLTGHSCLTPVIELAKAAGCRRLVLVHLNPLSQWAPQAADAQRIAGNLSVTLAADRQVIEL